MAGIRRIPACLDSTKIDEIHIEAKKGILLHEADRDELIGELKKRDSITFIPIPKGSGAYIKHIHGRVSLVGETNIFVIAPYRDFKEPNEK